MHFEDPEQEAHEHWMIGNIGPSATKQPPKKWNWYMPPGGWEIVRLNFSPKYSRQATMHATTVATTRSTSRFFRSEASRFHIDNMFHVAVQGCEPADSNGHSFYKFNHEIGAWCGQPTSWCRIVGLVPNTNQTTPRAYFHPFCRVK